MSPRTAHAWRRWRARRAAAGDEGVALILVLAFVMVMAVIVGSMLQQSYTTLRVARVTADIDSRVQLANAGVDYGIQLVRQGALRGNQPVCADPSEGPSELGRDLALTGGSRTVTVTCEATSGNATGAFGWAVYITQDTDTAIRSWPSAVQQKVIHGPVFNAGRFKAEGGASVAVEDGDVLAKSCPNDGTLRVNPNPPYACTAVSAADAPGRPLSNVSIRDHGDLLTASPQPPDGDGATSGCRTFSPGRYDQPLSFLGKAEGANYFRSGLYYLDDLGPVTIAGATVVGGIPYAPNDFPETSAVADSGACTFETASATSGQYGVAFVLGGSTTIDVRDDAQAELFAYVDPATGGAGLSFYQLGGEWGGAGASTVTGAGTTILGTRIGSKTALSAHGLVYLPDARVSLFGTNDSIMNLGGGVVAAGLDLQSGVGPNKLHVANRAGPGKRTLRIVAATNRVGTEKDLRAEADVSVTNDASHPLTVTSWKVNQ